MNYALIGLGGAGASLAAELVRRGQNISGWYDHDERIRSSVAAAGGLSYEGIIGQGAIALPAAASSAAQAIEGATVIVVATTADQHDAVAGSLASSLQQDQLVVLYCGYVGGGRVFATTVAAGGGPGEPLVAELNNTLHLAGLIAPGVVAVRAVKRWLECAAEERVLTHPLTRALLATFPEFTTSNRVLESGLNNPNPIGHVPATIGNAVLLDRDMGDLTTGVLQFEEARLGRVNTIAAAFEAERNRLIQALGLRPLPSMAFSKRAYPAGTRLYGGVPRFGPKIQARFLSEDVPCALVPMESLGASIGLATPITTAMIELANILAGRDFRESGRTVERFGREWLEGQTCSSDRASPATS